jgi:hypothetical protein
MSANDSKPLRQSLQLSPSVIAEYIGQSQCSRYAKHVFQDIDRSVRYDGEDFDEAFNPLNILLSKAGDRFETTVYRNSTADARRVTECEESGEDEFHQNHSELLTAIEEAVSDDEAWDDSPVLFYQPGLSGTICGWDVQGDADLIYIWSTPEGAEIRVIDVKRTSEQKVYHQIQAAIYIDLLDKLLQRSSLSVDTELGRGDRSMPDEDHSSTRGDKDSVCLSGGIVTWESDYQPFTTEGLPSFTVEPRIMDIRRLLSEGGPIETALSTPLEEAPHQLDQKCAQCPYNEGCISDAFAEGSVRLLGLSVAKQRQLKSATSQNIETVSDLASLGSTPSTDDWKPTTYKLPFGIDRELEATPGIGEELTQLIYRADGLLDTFNPESDGPSDRPRNWIPGTGSCSLPDDNPGEDTDFDHDYLHGSMVRVYLNIQHDHLRDRIIQVSARVTATESTTEPQRVSAISSGASDDIATANEHEQALLDEFTADLFDVIQDVAEGIEFPEEAPQNPPLHFYTYTDQEIETLTEAFDRHSASARIQALRSTIEGVDRDDDSMVSTLRTEITDHIILETPSPGLVHAYEELYPPSESYRKSHRAEDWQYTPADSETEYDLRHVFDRRLFDIDVAADHRGDRIVPDLDDYDSVNGVNTRMRVGASIPLGYLWSAVGRIDDDWAAEVDDTVLAEFELDNYRYRTNSTNEELQPTDLLTLGRHFCDMLEHVERSLVYSDATFTKAPYPVDELAVDSFESPSLATGARRYLVEEYRASREETYNTYRLFERQRIVSGESIPVKIDDIEQVSRRDLRVEGTLNYHGVFSRNHETIRSACSQTGNDGSSSGSWMVANEFHPSAPSSDVSEPRDIESGANATVEELSPTQNSITFTLQNFYGPAGDFGERHDTWTRNSNRRGEDDYLYVEEGKDLILDPKTDDITSGWTYDALEHADTNGIHSRLEAVRHGDLHNPQTSVFQNSTITAEASWLDEQEEQSPMSVFAQWLSEEVDADTYPSSQQQEFITEDDAQFVCLQGPPGTGKTAATMAPSLLARAYAATADGHSANMLVTAPSNTAIDQLLKDTAELLEQAESDDAPFASHGDVELVRIGSRNGTGESNVTYADYNKDAHESRIDRICERLHTDTHTHERTSGDGVAGSPGGDEQLSLSSWSDSSQSGDEGGADAESDSAKESEPPITIVFATVPRSWNFLKRYTPGSQPDTAEVAAQSVWDVIAFDEASMLEIPQLLHAGVGFREGGQVLVAGDHRQLPPVQKADWDDVRRRDIRETAAHLSALNYFRLLRGIDVLDEAEMDGFKHDCDREAVSIPLIQLDTTFRFDEQVASLMQRTLYSKDGIPYQANEELAGYETDDAPPDVLKTVFSGETSVALITYDPVVEHQQWNPIESIITQSLIPHTDEDTEIGVVTPHNAHRGHLHSHLPTSRRTDADGGWRSLPGRDTQIETVNKFQGGERHMMVVNATVSDPSYIDTESDFLLSEKRINVSLTRHSELLVVVVPNTILGYIPSDPDLYEEATIWKVLAADLGEAPTASVEPDWSDDLGAFLADTDWESETVPDFFTKDELLPLEVSIYTL